MAVEYTNIEMMSRCESEDFQRTSEILERLFQGRLRNLRPTTSGTSVDLRFEAVNKKGKVIKYAVEIKRNNGKYISNKTLPLLFTKYISMMKERKEDERLIEIFLLPTMFIVFDIDKVITDIPMKDLNMTNWLIPLENYSTRMRNERIPQPTIWLDTDKCSISGFTKWFWKKILQLFPNKKHYLYLCNVRERDWFKKKLIYNKLNKTMEVENKKFNGFIYVLNNPSLKGMVKIVASTKYSNEICRELSSTASIPTPFNVVYHLPSINPFKVESIVHTILDGYRVCKYSDFFKVDVVPTINLIEDIEIMLNKNYDASSTKGRYAAVGIALENRPFLLNKKFDNIEELTSLGIDGRFIFDYKEGRCLSRKYIPEEDRPKLEVK